MGIWEQLGLDMARHRMVALVGAGGKTSTLYALARQAADSGRTVVVTTTTHILRHPGLPLVEEPTPERLRAALEGHGVVTVGTVFRGDKLSGAGTPEELRRAADVVLVEADGAKRLPLKAPAEYEPVIPPCADAVAAVAGMDAVGQAVGVACHRPERVCALLGVGAEHVLTPEDAALLLASPQGGAEGCGGGHGLPLCAQQGGHPGAGGPRPGGGRTAGGAGHSQRRYLLSGGGAGRIMLVLIKGAGDLATGTAVRLYRAGIPVVMTEVARPTAVRRTVAFSQCMYDGAAQVEGIAARRAEDAGAARRALERGEVPVLCDPEAAILRELTFDGVVDAILAKRNLGTAITDAPVVLALGPGFTAGVDCHGVVETMRGHNLGRLLTQGSAAPNTGVPGDVGGYTIQRIIRAPADGAFEPLAAIGQRVEEGQPVARVAGRTACAQLTGVVRGMLPAGLAVTAGMKAGDIDPRCRAEHCFTVSDKARAIGGGVLEGLLYFGRRAGLWSV